MCHLERGCRHGVYYNLVNSFQPNNVHLCTFPGAFLLAEHEEFYSNG